jgi:hypothetical protein
LPRLTTGWHAPSEWISDPFGYVFLPRAMSEIGKALHPTEWTGAEPTEPVFHLLPELSGVASPVVKIDVLIALGKERPEFGRSPETDLPPAPWPLPEEADGFHLPVRATDFGA